MKKNNKLVGKEDEERLGNVRVTNELSYHATRIEALTNIVQLILGPFSVLNVLLSHSGQSNKIYIKSKQNYRAQQMRRGFVIKDMACAIARWAMPKPNCIERDQDAAIDQLLQILLAAMSLP
uniref:Alpha-L-iduronidase n=1 Tax=Lygus hesperus TaxID=30085 RepID=A0A0A9ZHP2_LYGHE